MKMGVDRYDPVHNSCKQAPDDFLADCLTPLEGRVLAHIAKIRRQQHEPLRSAAAQGFGGEQDREQLVVGSIERRVNDGRRRRRTDCHT